VWCSALETPEDVDLGLEVLEDGDSKDSEKGVDCRDDEGEVVGTGGVSFFSLVSTCWKSR